MINVFHIVSGKVWGGSEQYTADLMTRLKGDKYYAEVVCRKHDEVLQRFRNIEVPISILPLKGLTDIDSPIRLARLLRKGHNILHVHSFQDAWMAYLAKLKTDNPDIRIVLTIHDIRQPRLNMVTRKVYGAIDHFIFPSRLAYDTFLGKASQIDPKRASIIRESVLPDPTIIPPQKADRLAETPVIMYHGRLTEDKGIDVALKAVAQLDRNSYTMVVAGEGPEKFVSRLKGFCIANQMAQNVRFVGYREHVQSLVSKVDIGLIPTTAPEPMGICNLEYMMYGKALVTTNNGAQPEYLTDEHNALLVPPEDHLSTAAALQRLISDTALRQRLGENARYDFDTRLNYDTFFSNICEVYDGLF